MAFDATVGGPAATSYCTVAEADTYLGDRLFSTAWTGASTPTKQQALTSATAALDVLPWIGVKATYTQRLAWPRYDVPGDTLLGIEDWTTIPRAVKEAAMELALGLLSTSADPLAFDRNAIVTRRKVDVLETDYSAVGARPGILSRFPAVWQRIARYLAGAGDTVGRG